VFDVSISHVVVTTKHNAQSTLTRICIRIGFVVVTFRFVLPVLFLPLLAGGDVHGQCLIRCNDDLKETQSGGFCINFVVRICNVHRTSAVP
jgi:hypothetical protein